MDLLRPMRLSPALRAVTIALALAAVTAVAQASDAGGRDPRALVLARSDLPAGAKAIARQAPAPILPGTHGAAAFFKRSRHYEATYRLPGKEVYSGAFVFASQTAARAGFAKLSRSLETYHRPVRMPRLGDAQLTTYVVADGLEHQFIVRRGSIVWELDIVDWNAASRATSRAQALTLARKQQARVG
jgi:hypothetical protein